MREAPWSAAAKLPPSILNEKAVADATALQGAFGTTIQSAIPPSFSMVSNIGQTRVRSRADNEVLLISEVSVFRGRQYAPAVELYMMKRRSRASSFQQFLTDIGPQKTTREYHGWQTIYSQGDQADAMFYVQSGNVKLTVTSRSGKKAVVAVLGRGDLFGTECLAKQSLRSTGAAVLPQASIARVERGVFVRMIHQEPDFARLFISYLASRVGRIGEDLLDQHFSSSEQRLARVLLRLAHFGEGGKPEPAISAISQETLAQMVGTTRSRISHFMNKFRKLGYISYNGRLEVHGSLNGIVVHDWRSPHPGAPGFPPDAHF